MTAYILTFLSLFFAAFAHGSVGFGSAAIAIVLTSLIIGIKKAVPFVAPYSLLISVYLLWHARTHMQWRYISYPFVGTVLGVPLGVWLLKNLSSSFLQQMLGIFMIAYVICSLFWMKTHFKVRRLRFWGILSGFAGGITGGAIAMPGPPFVMFVTLSPWTKETIRGVLQTYIIFTYVLSMLLFRKTGLMGRETLLMNLYYLPSVLAGMAAGQALFKRIPQKWFIRGILALLAALGFKLVL